MIPDSLSILSADGRLLFCTRIVRLFAYGFLSVVLLLYLVQVVLSETQVGLLLSLTLVGDTLISLWLTTVADRIGRRRVLIVGAILMIFAGVLFALTRNFLLLLAAAVHPGAPPRETARGLVFGTDNRYGILVRAGQGVLSVTRLQLQAKKPMDWRSFLNGRKDFVGSQLGVEDD